RDTPPFPTRRSSDLAEGGLVHRRAEVGAGRLNGLREGRQRRAKLALEGVKPRLGLRPGDLRASSVLGPAWGDQQDLVPNGIEDRSEEHTSELQSREN